MASMAFEHSSGGSLQDEQHELTDSVGGAGVDNMQQPQLQPLLLVTTVDIGEGKSDRIEVRRGDVPMEVAREFVVKHGLPPAIIPRLAVHLEENLAKVEQKQAAADARKKLGASEDHDDEDEVAVFHRLYQQAIALRQKLDFKRDETKRQEVESINANRTSMSWISSEMMRDRSSGPFDNYGEMLYAESLEALARKRDKADRRKAEKELQEVAGATFKPEISRLAQNLWAPHECIAAPAWQRLSKVKMTKAQERLEMLRREKQEAEVKECTFKPQLNTRSEKLMTERSHTLRSLNVSAHQQLYQDAIRRQQKMQDYQHWYPEEVTFQPKLHESAMSREFLRKSLGPDGAAMLSASGEERHMALVNRLYASYEKLQNKLQEARNTLQTAVDPATGKKLFQPEIGRAPTSMRNSSHLPVGEYLYSLKQQQDDKVRAAGEELDRKRREEAEKAKKANSSKALVKALQQKRFRQIFDFLDQEGLGSFNLVALMNSVPEWLDDLDDEVRADLEMAARLLTKRNLKHNDSSRSEVSSIFMPPPPSAMDMADANGDSSAGEGNSSCTTPNGTPGVVNLQQFCAMMEEVLTTRRGPRTYLAPSPPRKYVHTETYKPQIDERSKQLAAKVRPKDTPLYEFLYQESTVLNQKKSERRARAVAEEASACTFAPRLVSQQLVREGRVMRGVRDGTWYHKSGGGDSELDCANSLQHLAAIVAEPADPQMPLAVEPAAAAVDGSGVCPPRSPAGAVAATAAAAAAAATAAATEFEAALDISATEQQQLEQLELEQLELETIKQSPVFKKQDSSRSRASRQVSRQQSRQEPRRAIEQERQQLEEQLLLQQGKPHQAEAAAGTTAVPASEDVDEFEGSEEQRQYLELEREVQQMLEATSAAAAAAAHLQSSTDQAYLQQILGERGGGKQAVVSRADSSSHITTGLAQEQVDALAPAISSLKGLEAHHSRASSTLSVASPGAVPGAALAAASTPAAASAVVSASGQKAELLAFTPQSSFRVNPVNPASAAAPDVPDLIDVEEQSPAADAAAAAAVAVSGSAAAGSLAAGAAGSIGSPSQHGELFGVGSTSGSKQSPRSLSRKDSHGSSRQPTQGKAGMISSRSNSKQLIDVDGMDLFELAAGLNNKNPQ